MKILFGIFLIAHGLIHTSFVSKKPPVKPGAPEWPFDINYSWLLSRLGVQGEHIKTIGILLTLVTVAGFILSGLAWLKVPLIKNYWIPITMLSSATSLLLLFLYWHNWFVMGPIINLAILYLIFFRNLSTNN